MSIDLHIHSVNSDGTFSVEEIVNLSRELQLEAISITDHEYLTEVPSDNDIIIIKGIEVGADWKELKSKNENVRRNKKNSRFNKTNRN